MKAFMIAMTADHPGTTKKLESVLKKRADYWHGIPNVWVVLAKANEDSVTLLAELHASFGPGGVAILIAEIGANFEMWLPEESASWLKEHLSANDSVTK